MNKHCYRTAKNKDNGNNEEYFLLSKEIYYLTFFSSSVEFRIANSNCIKRVHNQSGYNQGCKHRDYDTKSQSISKSLNCTGPKPHQHTCSDQSCDISIKDRGESFAETGFNGISYGYTCTDLLTNTRINNNVGIHCHTDTQDNTRNTRKSKCDVKGIQYNQHQ